MAKGSPAAAPPRPSRPSMALPPGLPAQQTMSKSPPVPPKPSELIDRYVAQGMERSAASEKVIEDLQAALQRSLLPMQRLSAMDRSLRTSAAQIDVASRRLELLEAKIDSKPGLSQIFVAGVAAGAFLKGAAAALPAAFVTLNDVCGSIRRGFERS